jgi:predicted RNase H-like HicB family nuclease
VQRERQSKRARNSPNNAGEKASHALERLRADYVHRQVCFEKQTLDGQFLQNPIRAFTCSPKRLNRREDSDGDLCRLGRGAARLNVLVTKALLSYIRLMRKPQGRSSQVGSKNQRTNTLTAIIQRAEEGYSSFCPELDVASQGETVEQARKNLQEAVELFLETAAPSELRRRTQSEVYVTNMQVAFG